MARRKKKKKGAGFSGVLKYEIYGIVLITLAVIALSGEATVGRSLSKMFGLMLGKFYFAIPLVGIYYGLMVMIQRKWPSGWTTRKTGLILLIFALTLMSTISAMHQKLLPVDALEPGAVLTQVHNDMQTELLTPAAPGERDSMLGKDISGGYLGAGQFALFLWLFGSLGARLIMIVMFVISFMLVTGLSYVDLMRIFRTKIWDAGSSMYKRWSQDQPGALLRTQQGLGTGTHVNSHPYPLMMRKRMMIMILQIPMKGSCQNERLRYSSSCLESGELIVSQRSRLRSHQKLM